MVDGRDRVAQSSPGEVMAALRRAWARSDWLFDRVPRQRWLERGIVLRHPFLFYVGHLPSFAWNHLSSALGLPPFDAELDALFARGIDPADEAEANTLAQPSWPPIDDVLAYRDAIREAVAAQQPAVEAGSAGDPVVRDVLPLILEHELMHHETLLYMIRQLEPGGLVRPGDWRDAEPGPAGGPRHRVAVEAGSVRLGAERAEIAFGWDNEFPSEEVVVDAFDLDRLPVTIGEYLGFVRDGGYEHRTLWSEVNFAWQTASGRAMPLGWRQGPEGIEVRSMFRWHHLDTVRGWPVYVSHAEARAFCAWAGGRLPTEAELHRAAFTEPGGGERPFPWGSAPVGPDHGGIDFHVHGRLAVGSRPAARSAWGIDELVGNGWEWTSNPFLPRVGFSAIHPNYPGYSADFFDGEHFVVFGASWATDARLVRRSFRNWYQGRYPYVFATFRTAS